MKKRSKNSGGAEPGAKRSVKGLSNLNPYRVLQDAIRAVPAVKYALGVAGIVSVIAIISAFRLDLRIAGFGTVITFVLMVTLVIFAKLTTIAPRHFVAPVLVLMWSFLALTIFSALLLFSSVFFGRPIDLVGMLKPVFSGKVAALPAGAVLKVAYTSEPPAPNGSFAKPQLQFEILAKRKGEQNFSILKNGDALASTVDDYLIAARPMSPGYLYIFQVDSSGKKQWLFPQNRSSEFSSGANPVEAMKVIQLPPKGGRFNLDATTGIEHIYAVFSASRWPDLEDALAASGPASVASPPSDSAGASRGVRVEEPNGLRSRGIAAINAEPAMEDVQKLLPADGANEDVSSALALGNKPYVASGSHFEIECWFKHVDAP
jgi:hypothetical protein